MQWKEFNKDCPQDVEMLFLDDKKGWFSGTLENDSEFGLVISTFENYWGINDITHYLIIELPEPQPPQM